MNTNNAYLEQNVDGHGRMVARAKRSTVLGLPRGKPIFLNGKYSLTFLEASRREHSRKPEEFYELVEATCPGRKVDLSRFKTQGMVAYGNDTNHLEVNKAKLWIEIAVAPSEPPKFVERNS